MSQMIEKIEASVAFDEAGNIPRGESGERVPPADPAENTAPPAPSPDPATIPADKAAPVEKKADDAAPVPEPAPGTAPAKATETPDDAKLESAEEAALKEKYSKPGDKTGNEWQIRAYRDGEKVKKALAPVQDVMDRIGSPDRARRGLELTADLADPEVPIASAVSKMTALSSSRFDELQTYLYDYAMDNYPDTVAADLVGEKTTLAELKEGLQLLRSGAKTGAQPQSKTTDITKVELTKPEGMADDDWDDLQNDPGLKPAFEAMKAMQAQLAAKPAEVKEPELSPAEKQLKAIQDERQQEAMNKGWEEIKGEYGKLYDSAFEVVDNGLRDLGLVPDPAKDDDKTTKLKTRTAERIQEAVYLEFEGPNGPNRTKDDPEGQEDWSLCSEEQKLNRGLIKRVHALMLKKDFAAANDYLDRIRAQVDLAFQRASDPELDLYNAAMLQSTTPKPRDGSAHTRPELVGGTAPGGAPANKTPWLDPGYRQPGETSQAAMMRYLESQAA